MDKCQDKSACSIEFSTKWFDSDCLKSKSGVKLYLKMYCKEAKISFLGWERDKADYSLLVVGVNIASVVSYILFLLMAKITEQSTKADYRKNKATPSSYSIQVKNLPARYNEQDLISELYLHFNQFWVNKVRYDKRWNYVKAPVVDIAVAQSNETFLLQKKIYDKGETMTFLYEKVRPYIEELAQEKNSS